MTVQCKECNEVSRRSFITRAGAAFGAMALGDPILRMVAQTYAQSAGGTGNILVLCQLNGGFDALSFLAPFTNPTYIANRPQLALDASQVTPLADRADFGINNQFGYFNELYAARQCAIIQQVAYPRGNGSHFESQEIYEYGVRNLASPVGTSATWYERLRRTYFNAPFGVMSVENIGDPQRYGYPDTTYRRGAATAFGRLATLKQNRNATQQAVLNQYSRIDQLGAELRAKTAGFTSGGTARGEFYRAAQLASALLGTQIFKVEYGGFDTHGSQIDAQNRLFPRLDTEFRQFAQDMQALGLWDRTAVLFYSEFGRRNRENGSPGTDHGHGGHMILCGPRVRGGLLGQAPTSSDLGQTNLPYYVDFRGVYANVIRNWLGFDPNPIFQVDGETYDENIGGALLA